MEVSDTERKGCSLIIVNDRRQIVLLLRDDIQEIPYPNMWDIPGGAVERGESPKEAIIREIDEEMEIKLDDVSLFSVIPFDDRTEYTYWIKLNLDLEKIHLTEGQRLKWFEENEIKKMNLAFRFNRIVDKFYKEAPFKMKKETEKSVSDSLETTLDFLPYLPDLLIDLWALGSSPQLVVDLIRPLELPPQRTRVLDLGCGKGAVMITLAKTFGFHATGIDACQPFLEIAKEKASEFNVSDLCEFQLADIRDIIKKSGNYDIVIYASLGNILGSFKECVSNLRNTVRPGGYIIIDDGYLKGSKRVNRAGYEHYVPHHETIKQLTYYGDILIKELSTEQETREINNEYLQLIKKRAKALVEKDPHIEKSVMTYIQNQEIECEMIDKYINGAIWLLKRN
jgi:mutator protein MutT